VFLLLGRERRRRRRWRRQSHVERTLKLCFRRSRPASSTSLRCVDSLHECLPADSAERLAIERNHLGMEISDAMASFFSCVDADGTDDVTWERDGMLFSHNVFSFWWYFP
jgi:hypothetical protein